jgi:hypothetical protein
LATAGLYRATGRSLQLYDCSEVRNSSRRLVAVFVSGFKGALLLQPKTAWPTHGPYVPALVTILFAAEVRDRITEIIDRIARQDVRAHDSAALAGSLTPPIPPQPRFSP